ncbi:hypothetical protein PENARI_c006G07618 [Penicillium arizonense]|uniref:Uncharacterized protein n=1 Tax=Penicillium arizonense TaxID=1835702 RepID=A0A1F5LLQ6_PENAI|nr:hypothetical protein PENARI_c006G07618 [Penicillium arizonense]OGE54162.1 hypothetical protein PENARI_c006G07618 [Penicillium arizonense]
MPDYKYGRQPKGRMFRKWMESPREPGCPVARSTLNLDHRRRHPEFRVTHNPTKLSASWNPLLAPLGLTLEHPDVRDSGSQYRDIEIMSRHGSPVNWCGRTGPGVIFIDNVYRSHNNARLPHMSDLTKVAYEMDFSLSSLKYEVYRSVVPYEYPSRDPLIWHLGTAEFDALLGTGIASKTIDVPKLQHYVMIADG